MLKLIRLVCALFITSGLVTAAADESLLRDAIGADYDYLAGLFEHFHRHPELSYREEETARRLARELRDAGVEVTEGVGGTGLVGIIENGAGPIVMLRADMDGLP
ncbi:MAG: amidohydrolase, partial [Gammaproteobacteria bacterium]